MLKCTDEKILGGKPRREVSHKNGRGKLGQLDKEVNVQGIYGGEEIRLKLRHVDFRWVDRKIAFNQASRGGNVGQVNVKAESKGRRADRME